MIGGVKGVFYIRDFEIVDEDLVYIIFVKVMVFIVVDFFFDNVKDVKDILDIFILVMIKEEYLIFLEKYDKIL